MIRSFWWIALLATSAPAGSRASAPCPDSLAQWKILRGALRPGLACGRFIGLTDGFVSRFSYGSFQYTRRVRLPYRVSVRWRRLGAVHRDRPLELQVPGAVLLLKKDAAGLWTYSDSRFEADGWHPIPGGYDTLVFHRVELEQRADGILLRIDGKEIRRWAFVAPAAEGYVAIGFKGEPGLRARMELEDFRLEPLGAQGQASPASAPR